MWLYPISRNLVKIHVSEGSKMRERPCDLPVDVGGIGEKTNAKGVDGSITPAFVEEPTGAIQVLEVGLVLFAAEEVEIANFEVGPEVAGGVSIGALGMPRTSHVIRNPLPHVVIAEVRRVGGEESLSLGP
jgi:hypothetical protein